MKSIEVQTDSTGRGSALSPDYERAPVCASEASLLVGFDKFGQCWYSMSRLAILETKVMSEQDSDPGPDSSHYVSVVMQQR